MSIFRNLRRLFQTIISRMMNTIVQMEEKGLNSEQAQIEAFYANYEEGGGNKMGKPTGFMEYERETAKAESPLERIHHFNEFHTPLSREKQQPCRAARCMALRRPILSGRYDDRRNGQRLSSEQPGAGVERSGLYSGCWEQAYSQTDEDQHCFPEFTSRVCPASV